MEAYMKKSDKLVLKEKMKGMSLPERINQLQVIRKKAFTLAELIEKLQVIEDRKLISNLSNLPRIDLTRVADLGSFGASPQEISAVLLVDFTAIKKELLNPESPLSIVYNMATADIKQQLRRAQLKRAIEDRSDTMLTFMGKQMLGQVEKVEVDNPDALNEMLRNPEKMQKRLTNLNIMIEAVRQDETQVDVEYEVEQNKPQTHTEKDEE